MTFAGNFLTEEMERQSRYNVVQIVVKTMTREPRQRYLKVKCTLFRTRLMAESQLSMLYVCTNGYFFVICPWIQ